MSRARHCTLMSRLCRAAFWVTVQAWTGALAARPGHPRRRCAPDDCSHPAPHPLAVSKQRIDWSARTAVPLQNFSTGHHVRNRAASWHHRLALRPRPAVTERRIFALPPGRNRERFMQHTESEFCREQAELLLRLAKECTD